MSVWPLATWETIIKEYTNVIDLMWDNSAVDITCTIHVIYMYCKKSKILNEDHWKKKLILFISRGKSKKGLSEELRSFSLSPLDLFM